MPNLGTKYFNKAPPSPQRRRGHASGPRHHRLPGARPA
nr:MAG TPA: hypothetical protein [Caudoviricetes sp.]DAV30033.1 MAG TPA: hypothetical protein [Caudoviricetes sp.]